MKCKIADLVFDINGNISPILTNALSAYLYYGFDETDINVQITINNNIQKYGKPTAVISGRNWIISDDCDVTFDIERITGDCVTQTIADKQWNNLSIEVCNLHEKYGIQDDYYMFNILGEIFRIIILKHDGVILHSSSISYKDNGILFSAPSGTGKSTHTGLWIKMFPDDAAYVNDDTPALRWIDNTYYLFGTPWAGSTGINNNVKVPLKGIVFLKRGETNSIVKANPIEAINMLVNETRRPLIKEMIELSLNRIESIIGQVPIYILSCTISEDAVQLVKNTIGL